MRKKERVLARGWIHPNQTFYFLVESKEHFLSLNSKYVHPIKVRIVQEE